MGVVTQNHQWHQHHFADCGSWNRPYLQAGLELSHLILGLVVRAHTARRLPTRGQNQPPQLPREPSVALLICWMPSGVCDLTQIGRGAPTG